MYFFVNLSGLDDGLNPYVQAFLNEGYTGERLLRITPQDLDDLRITKLGHQEILLEAVDLLKSIVSTLWSQYEWGRMVVRGNLFLNYHLTIHCLDTYNEIRSTNLGHQQVL